MADVSVTNKGDSIASKLLKAMGSKAQKPITPRPKKKEAQKSVRPGRLGLGAKPEKATAASRIGESVGKKVQRGLGKKKRKQEEQDEANEVSDEDAEEMESKTNISAQRQAAPDLVAQLISEKKNKKKKRKKKKVGKPGDNQGEASATKANEAKEVAMKGAEEKIENNNLDFSTKPTDNDAQEFSESDFPSSWTAEPSVEAALSDPRPSKPQTKMQKTQSTPKKKSATAVSVTPVQPQGPQPNKDKGTKTAKKIKPQNEDDGTKQEKAKGANGANENESRNPGDSEPKPRKKRPKKRSRQKNIRKDNRPAHKKPSYLPVHHRKSHTAKKSDGDADAS